MRSTCWLCLLSVVAHPQCTGGAQCCFDILPLNCARKTLAFIFLKRAVQTVSIFVNAFSIPHTRSSRCCCCAADPLISQSRWFPNAINFINPFAFYANRTSTTTTYARSKSEGWVQIINICIYARSVRMKYRKKLRSIYITHIVRMYMCVFVRCDNKFLIRFYLSAPRVRGGAEIVAGTQIINAEGWWIFY